MRRVIIHYFSGTGNTYHMVKLIGNRLKQHGYEIIYENIEYGNKEQFNDAALHIFSYPIYAFGTPSIVLRYLKNLKLANGCKASVICSCVEFEGQSLTHVTKLLKKKGYDVFLTDVGIYPHNWTQIANPIDKKKQNQVFECTDKRIIELTDKIVNSEVNIKKCNIFNLIWSWMVFLLFSVIGRRILGKVFKADNSCIACQKCIKVCPIKAIKLKKGKPKWNWKCENCQRCINICPNNSIQASPLRLIIFILNPIFIIFVLISLNKNLYLPIWLNIVLYCIVVLISNYFIDIIIHILERTPMIKKLFEYSFTKNYRRYIVKEFEKTF